MKNIGYVIIGFLWSFFFLFVFCYQGNRIESLNDEIMILKTEVYQKDLETKKLIKEQAERTARIIETCFEKMNEGWQ